MEDKFIKSKRIASNTAYLFVRMFVLMLINLYAVRVVFKGLGEEDYGLFNTVAGLVMISSFLNGVLAISIQRFYSYSIGEGNVARLRDIFSSSLNIIAVLCAVILVVLETVGLWFVYAHLTIPAERLTATVWAYQFSIFTFIFTMLQIPFTSAIFAHEDIGTYSVISTVDCLFRLVAALLIVVSPVDKLIFYCFGLFVASCIILLCYVSFCRRHYTECKYQNTKDKSLYKSLLSFSSWTLFGSLSSTFMQQGNIVLLNIFFGPLINAAFGIAMQICNAFNALCNSIIIPLRPPMTKAYAEKNYSYLDKLFSVGNKIILYVLVAVAIPLLLEMDTILSWWLHDINDNTVLFSRLIIIYVICLAMNAPITTIMQAAGKVREYHLPVESVTIMCLPVTWLLFYIGCPASYVCYAMIGVCVAAHVVRLVCLKKHYQLFSCKNYMFGLILPGVVITLASSFLLYQLHVAVDHRFVRFLIVSLLSPLAILLSVYLIGITKEEKTIVKSLVHSIIEKKLCRR